MSRANVVVSRVLELGLVLVGAAVLWVGDPSGWLLVWDVLAGVYVATWALRLLRGRHADDPAQWLDQIPDSWTALAVTLLTSAVGLVAVIAIVADQVDEDFGVFTKLVAAAAALLAWFLLHLGYAEQYARTYYRRLPTETLSFPDTPRPNLLDFAYFAFTIGVSFAVSDVETHTRGVRAQVLVHAIIGFFYNAAVIGVAVGVVTGGH
ncbi:DUF1345 domain-containing protein [Nocardia thailandica]